MDKNKQHTDDADSVAAYLRCRSGQTGDISGLERGLPYAYPHDEYVRVEEASARNRSPQIKLITGQALNWRLLKSAADMKKMRC